MAPNVERRRLVRQTYGILEGVAISHQGCCRQDSVEVRFYDSFVHAVRETEVIGVDNEALQNSTSLMVRNFFGVVRISLSRPVTSRAVPFSVS